MNYKITTLLVSAIAGTALMVGCSNGTSTNVNVNARNSMTNMGANNANVGAVVVNNNTNSSGNSVGPSLWANTNVSREDYEKNKSGYEKEKGSSTIGTGVNDSWLWFKTRAALMTANDLRDSTINVDVVDEVITLKGSVATAAQKAQAEKVANGIEGKKKVVNQLTVAPKDSMTNTSSSNSHSNSNSGKK